MRDVIIIFGKTGTGKSTLALDYIKEYDRVIILDPKEEYEGLIFTDIESLIDFYKINKPDNFTFVCRFSESVDIENLFLFCELIENLLIVVEECELYVSPYVKSSNFLKLVRYGRHHDISILGIARRASELSSDFKAMVSRIISFKQTLPRDIKIMAELGLENVDTLPEYQFISVDY